jgi:hypothetical protein
MTTFADLLDAFFNAVAHGQELIILPFRVRDLV